MGSTPPSRSSARADAIVTTEIHGAADLPVGTGDRQDPGAYRIVPRQDREVSGFAALA